VCDIVCKRKYKLPSSNQSTVDSGYFEFDGIVKKIRVNRTSTQEELRKYRKCSLFNDERLGPYLVWSTFACPAIPPGLGPGPSPDTHVTVSSEDILKDMLEVKKFPLSLQLLIKSNIFSNFSKLRNYTSSLIKINFRQIIQ
jgi:hypothetical protein